MKVFKIKSIPIDQVILELGGLLGLSIENECEEYTIKIPASIGSGYIKGVAFPTGLGFINYACTFKEDIEIHYIRNRVHPLKFIYNRNGILNHNFEENDEFIELEPFQYCVLASQSKLGHIFKFSKNTYSVFNSMEINREVYSSYMSCSIEKMDGTLKGLFKDIKAQDSFYYKGFYNLEMADLLAQIEHYDGMVSFRKIFLESMVNRMLLQELSQFEAEYSKDSSVVVLQKHEIAALAEANLIITNEISNLPTIRQISYRVGLNPNKLQDGFKRLYGSTVNAYVRDKRLEISKELLLNTLQNMAEISDQVGITSKSYFSKMFKYVYGMSPNEFRKKNT